MRSKSARTEGETGGRKRSETRKEREKSRAGTRKRTKPAKKTKPKKKTTRCDRAPMPFPSSLPLFTFSSALFVAATNTVASSSPSTPCSFKEEQLEGSTKAASAARELANSPSSHRCSPPAARSTCSSCRATPSAARKPCSSGGRCCCCC